MATKKSDRSRSRAEVVAEYKRQQARSRRRGRLLLAAMIAVAVVIVGGAVVFVGLNRSSDSAAATTTASAATVKAVGSVPTATYDTIGAGTASAFPKAIDAPDLTADGKPRVLYDGAEYCPYCAAERWSVVAALSRFGTFADLGATTSASADVYPDTATLSFHGSSYTSKYLSFTGVETMTNQPIAGGGYTELDSLTKADQALVKKYDYPPYVDGQGGSIPFVDLGGQFVISGASYDPAVLKGKTQAEIVAALADPTSDIAQAVDGSANAITASLCQLTGGKPTAVCTSAGVLAGAAKLG